MARPRTRFVCQACGYASPRWLGRCTECEAWDSFVEEAAPAARPAGRIGAAGAVGASAVAAPLPLAAVGEEAATRFGSGMPLLDRVLGGGVVAGGAVLLAGEPGIGKSTLLLQLAEALARGGRRVLYASAEESTRQLRLRAERLGCGHPGLLVAGETAVEAVLAAATQCGAGGALRRLDPGGAQRGARGPARARSGRCAPAPSAWSTTPSAPTARSSSSAT